MGDVLSRLRSALAGRYTLERELGHGGMATVWLAHDLKHDRSVALKVLRPEVAAALGPERFLREITVTASLQHPHILPLLDSGRASGRLFYVMPYVAGESLRERLRREKQLPLAEALQLTREVADALDYAHAHGVVHRDIKPENILLESGHAVVADFGIAKALTAAGGDELTATGIAVGTPAYMSPEQGVGSGEVDGRSDLYSLGCVLYEMLSGETPYLGSTPQTILAKKLNESPPRISVLRETVPADVEAALSKVLTRTPADRFRTAREFAEALTAGGDRRRPTPAQRRWAIPLVTGLATVGAFGIWGIRRAGGPALSPSASVIAVVPFAAAAPDSQLTALGNDLAATLSANLDGVGELRTVDRLTILPHTSGRRVLTREQAAALGRRFGAGSIVHGTLVRQGPAVRADVDLYTADSLVSLARISVTAPAESIAALTDSITWRLLREVWRGGRPPSPSLGAVTTRSVPALRAFLDGEQLLAHGQLDRAAEAYRRAFTEDSTFWMAYFRYAYVFEWQDRVGADSLAGVAWEHRAELPLREQQLMEIARETKYAFGSVQLVVARDYVARHPHYWPGWLQYADYMMHEGGRLGHTLDEIAAPFEQTVALNPNLAFAWDHLFWLRWGRDAAGARRAAMEAGRVAGTNWRRLFTAAVAHYPTLDTAALDSVARPMVDSGRAGRPVGACWISRPLGLAMGGFPRAQIELNQRVLRAGVAPPVEVTVRRCTAIAWTGRGAWDSAAVEFDRRAAIAPAQRGATPALEAYQAMIVAVWLGALDSTHAVRQREAARNAVARFPGVVSVRSLRILDGLLAATEGDRPGLERALKMLATDTSSGARVHRRMLGAYALAVSNRYREAADSMLAFVAEQAELGPLGGGIVNNDYRWLDGLNRLAASRWLLAAGDTVGALDPIRNVAAFDGPQHVMFDGPAYFQLALIWEALGNTHEARRTYAEFLRRYDLPTPAHRRLVLEATRALTRLGNGASPPISGR
ncbi:MAG TPA: protein kinase [Gemmatimonadales bacterium]|nr:protein kinase [Gemmatimonadales bacterium]